MPEVKGYSLSPQYLRDECIPRALQETGVQSLDLFLLQFPEYSLSKGQSKSDFYKQIKETFAALEQEVLSGMRCSDRLK